ncbi:MAG: serine--tRNA ligase [Microgenomates group bacterium]
MLDINFIRQNPEKVKEGVKKKGYDPKIVDRVLKVDETRRQLIGEIEKLRAERNKLGPNEIEKGKKIKETLRRLEPGLQAIEEQLKNLLYEIPNLPSDKAPIGKDESENIELRRWGEPKKFPFKPKDHLELGKLLGILDFEAGAKVTGSGFYYWQAQGAILELALIHYAFDLLRKEGFVPIITPDLARSRYWVGTGYLPKGPEAQTYTIEGEDLGLIATAEVTLAGKHADEIIPEEDLPLKYIGYSCCFRREAGAYGKYSKGLYRVHQFTKAEIFIYCLPEESPKWHEYILQMEEKIYQNLGLPYRVVEMCTGDLGAMAARKFDIEVWMPGRNEYGEVTSTSNCTDYQARNLNIKVRRKNGKTEYLHMLNGTAIATSRTSLAILENYQQKDGSVLVPKVLQKYTGFSKISPKNES